MKYIDSTVSNSRDSPLLRLPPELRNRIYELTLGGLRISVDEMYLRFHKRMPRKTSIQSDSSTSVLPRAYSHAICLFPSTCRQIYSETATLLFELNRFYVSTSAELGAFVGNISPTQRDAITEITIWSTCLTVTGPRLEVHKKFRDLPQVCAGMTSLRRIHLFLCINEE